MPFPNTCKQIKLWCFTAFMLWQKRFTFYTPFNYDIRAPYPHSLAGMPSVYIDGNEERFQIAQTRAQSSKRSCN